MEIKTFLPKNLLIEEEGAVNLLHSYMAYCNNNKVNYKLTLVLDYLQINKTLKGYTSFSIEDIIKSYGYKSDSHKGKINEQIINMIKFLAEKNIIIDLSCNVEDIKANTFVKCKYKGIATDNQGNYTDYSLVDYKDIEKIINNKDKLDVAKLFTYLSYICGRMYKNNKGTEVARDGGKYEVCYPSYLRITKDININSNTIDKYNKWLMDNNIIKYQNVGNYYLATDKKKVIKQDVNMYVLVDGNENTNLKEGIKQYKAQYEGMRIYVSNDTKKKVSTKRQESNTIQRLEVLKEQGKATDRQIKKLNEMVENRQQSIDYNIEDLKEQLKQLTDDGDYRRVLDLFVANGESYTVKTYLDAIEYLKHENELNKSKKCDFENTIPKEDNPKNELYKNDIDKLINSGKNPFEDGDMMEKLFG